MGLIHPLLIFRLKIKFVFSFFPSTPLPPFPLKEMARKDRVSAFFFPSILQKDFFPLTGAGLHEHTPGFETDIFLVTYVQSIPISSVSA